MVNIDEMRKEAAASANNVGYCVCGNHYYLFFHLILDVGWQIKCGECGARTDFYQDINKAVAAWNRKAIHYQGLYEFEQIYNDIKYIHMRFPFSQLLEEKNNAQEYREIANKIIDEVNKGSSQKSKEGAKKLEEYFKDMKVEV